MKTRLFWSHFISAMAAFASLATLITFFFIDGQSPIKGVWTAICLMFVLTLCGLYAVYMTYSNNKIVIEFNPSFEFTIEEGDVFDTRENCVIVIPVNTHFDPHIVKRENSVFYKFINSKWKDRMEELEGKINSGLRQENIKGVGDNDGMNKNIYPLGTCITVKDGGNNYVLVATANKQKNQMSELLTSDFSVIVDGLFKYLSKIYVNERIFMPLFGTGHGSMLKTSRRVLYHLLDEIEFKYSNLSFPFGVCLKIRSLNRSNINLSEVEKDFQDTLKS